MEHVLRGLSGWLVQYGAIKPDDRELYEYATYSFLVSVIPLAIFLLVSATIGMLLEGVMIIIPFMITRKFSGGYHAKHAYVCLLISVGLLVICLYVVAHIRCNWIFHMLMIISGLSIAASSPIDSENKKLMNDDIRQYKRMTCMIVAIIMLTYAALLFFQVEQYAVCLAVSLILSSFLQLPCILKKFYLYIFAQN